jgi:hypothetical protein
MKKAQIRIFESIAVLVIFIIFVAIGLRFYTTAQMNDLRKVAAEFSELDAVKVTLLLSHMPELACSFEGRPDSSCMDLEKINAMKYLLNNTPWVFEHYLPIIGLSDVIVTELYPATDTIMLHNASIQNTSLRIARVTSLTIPKNIQDPETGYKKIGTFTVKTSAVRR